MWGFKLSEILKCQKCRIESPENDWSWSYDKKLPVDEFECPKCHVRFKVDRSRVEYDQFCGRVFEVPGTVKLEVLGVFKQHRRIL